jgi:D-alanine-D-alanine ligase
LKILVVYNVVEMLDKGDPTDIFAEQEMELVEQEIERALNSCGHETVVLPIRDQLWEALGQFDPNEWLIFNLCENLRGKAYLEPFVVSVYEYLRFRYTGSSRVTITTCLNKARTKEILRAHGIPTAPFQVLSPGNWRRELDFPLFVKPVAEDASLGITRSSVVQNDRELRQQVRFIWDRYRQPALVESFIQGREFNVTILGNETPRVLPLSEIDFKRISDPYARIVTYQGKWVPHSEDYRLTTAVVPAHVGDKLRLHISDIALRAYKVMGLRDYGRVDIRVKNGVPYVLEVNPNADLSEGAGIANAARAAGMSYADLADEIVRLAAQRYRLKFPRPRISSLRVKPLGSKGNWIRTVPVSAFAKVKERRDEAKLLATA